MEEPKLRDYYGDLGVLPESNTRQIKKAFHKLAIRYHPDKSASGGSNNVEESCKASIYELIFRWCYILEDQKADATLL